jgi:hypothetical protein
MEALCKQEFQNGYRWRKDHGHYHPGFVPKSVYNSHDVVLGHEIRGF